MKEQREEVGCNLAGQWEGWDKSRDFSGLEQLACSVTKLERRGAQSELSLRLILQVHTNSSVFHVANNVAIRSIAEGRAVQAEGERCENSVDQVDCNRNVHHKNAAGFCFYMCWNLR